MRVRASAGAASFRRLSTLKACRRRAEQEGRAAAQRARRRPRRRQPTAGAARSARRRGSPAAGRARPWRRPRNWTRCARRHARKAAADKDGPPPPGGKDTARKKRRAPRPRRPRGQGDEDGRWRLPPGLQRPVRRRHPKRRGSPRSRSTTSARDMGKMAPMSDAPRRRSTVARPRQHLADGGFAKLDDIETPGAGRRDALCRRSPAATRPDAVIVTRRCPMTRPRVAAWRQPHGHRRRQGRSTRSAPPPPNAPMPRPATAG